MSHGRKEMLASGRTDGRQVTKEGWLMKEGGAARTKWQNRWFRLQGKTINYFTKRDDSNPQGVIHLDEVKDVSKIGEHSARPHCMAMVTLKDKAKGGKKVYYLSADSGEELHEWFVAFQANLAPDVPVKLLKYSTVEVFLTQGIRISGDVSYDILSYISHRVPLEKKKRDALGWFCDRPVPVGMVLNLFSQYGWAPEHIYRSTAISGLDANVILPCIRIIFSKSPLDAAKHGSGPTNASPQASPNMSTRFESSGKIMSAILGAAGKLSGLGGKSDENMSSAPQHPSLTPEAELLEGADEELISLMEEFNIPLSLLEVGPE